MQGCFVEMARETRGRLDEHPDRRLALLVDELRFVHTRAEPFQWILRRPMRAAAQVILTPHRPTDVPPDIRAIVDTRHFAGGS